MNTAAPSYVQLLALGIAPEWRRRSGPERARDFAEFCSAAQGGDRDAASSISYSSIGLEPGVDVCFWRTAPSLDALEESAARLLRSGLGAWSQVRHSFIGRTGPSQYAAKPSDQEFGFVAGDRGRYLIAYPFTKSTDWYLESRETRQSVMNEHMRVGRRYPSVRQALAYSFGLDDQDFLVAYETDDLAAFGDLVRELRGTESRRATVRDTPIVVAVHRPLEEIGSLLGVLP